MIRSKCIALLLSAVLILAFTGVARAAFTTPVNAGSASETSVWDILNDLLDPVTDYNSTTMNNIRIDDYSPGLPDQIWEDGVTTITFTALWWGGGSGDNLEDGPPVHTFGYNLNGGSDTTLFTVAGSGGDSNYIPGTDPVPGVDFGDEVVTTINPGAIRWWAYNPSYPGNGNQYSDPSYGPNVAIPTGGSTDRMITFDVSNMILNMYDGAGGITQDVIDTGDEAYLLFWDTGSDADYNDLVVLVEDVHPVPEPGTLLLLGSGLAGLGGFARLKLRRRRKS